MILKREKGNRKVIELTFELIKKMHTKVVVGLCRNPGGGRGVIFRPLEIIETWVNILIILWPLKVKDKKTKILESLEENSLRFIEH